MALLTAAVRLVTGRVWTPLSSDIRNCPLIDSSDLLPGELSFMPHVMCSSLNGPTGAPHLTRQVSMSTRKALIDIVSASVVSSKS